MRYNLILLLVPFVLGAAPTYSRKEIQAWKNTYRRPKETPYPPQNPYSLEKAELGKTLFFDPLLSGGNNMSCATCHDPKKAWGDGRPLGIGHEGKTLGRRVPELVNLAWGKTFFWDGRAVSLEEQAGGPLQNPDEMHETFENAIKELSQVPAYKARFEKAFPGKGITQQTITQAIATFERSVVTAKAPFDSWVEGKEKAISESAKRGFVIFNTTARCSVCHDSWNFSDGSFADTGLDSDDPGMGKLDPSPLVQHFFKTPSLRNVGLRSAFMHNGSLKTLKDVVALYNQGGQVKRKTLSPDIKPLNLTAQEEDDLIHFLETLTSRDPLISAPPLPR